MSKRPQPVIFSVSWPACIQCGACVAVCLQREPFVSAFDTIALETPCKIACMYCVEACPTSAITHREHDGRRETYWPPDGNRLPVAEAKAGQR
jgi:ferredoxin